MTISDNKKTKEMPFQNRCEGCNKLLGVGDPGNIVIKCPRCRKLNRFKKEKKRVPNSMKNVATIVMLGK